MSREKLIRSLIKDDGTEVTNLNSSFTSRPYQMGSHLHLGIQLKWTGSPLGIMHLEYSCDPDSSSDDDFEPYNSINMDGSFDGILFLDSNVAIAQFRLRYESTSGTTSAFKSSVLRKGG
jgi:hypothetical protein